MPQCKKCGKSYSIWDADIVNINICRECKVDIAATAAAEILKDSFACLAPDIPLTTGEKIRELGAFGGEGRGFPRSVRIKLVDGQLCLLLSDSDGNWVKAGNLVAVQDVENMTLSSSPMVFRTQWKTVLKRSIGIGIGIGFVFAVVLVNKTGDIRVLPLGLLSGIIFGIICAGLFDFLPGLFKTRRSFYYLGSVYSLEIRDKAGNILTFGLQHGQIPKAKNVLAKAGLTLSQSI